MQMHDHIAHLRIIDRALSRAAPSCFSARIIGQHAHDIDRIQVLKFQLLRVSNPPAHDKVQQAQDYAPDLCGLRRIRLGWKAIRLAPSCQAIPLRLALVCGITLDRVGFDVALVVDERLPVCRFAS